MGPEFTIKPPGDYKDNKLYITEATWGEISWTKSELSMLTGRGSLSLTTLTGVILTLAKLKSSRSSGTSTMKTKMSPVGRVIPTGSQCLMEFCKPKTALGDC